MATEKKTAATEGLSVEERLKTLYQLQTLLSQIDRIKNLRGELPLEVKDMDDEVERLKTRIQKFKNEAEELRKGVAAKKVEIQNAQDAIAKYTEQQNNVRNNKEFDFLAKEIGFKQLEIELAEKRIREYTEMANRKADDIKSTQEPSRRKSSRVCSRLSSASARMPATVLESSTCSAMPAAAASTASLHSVR